MSTYFAILTELGEAKLANAIALGGTLKLKNMAVGDGNGNLPMPDRKQKALVREVRRAGLNQLTVDPANASQIIVEQVLPEDVGGWWLREIGIYDEAGDLCVVANCPPNYKPVMTEGSGRTQVVRVVLIVASTAAIELKIDPSVVLATRKYVDEQIMTVRACGAEELGKLRSYVDEQDSKVMIYSEQQLAGHVDAADPHPRLAQRGYVDEQDGKVMIYSEQQLAGHVDADNPHPRLAKRSYVDQQDDNVRLHGEQQLENHMTDVRRYADAQDGKVMIYSEQQLAAHREDVDPHPRLAQRNYVDEQDSKVMVYGEEQLAKHAEAKDPHPQYSMKEVATLSKFDASKKLVNAEFVRTNGVRHGGSFGFSVAAALTVEHVGGFIYTFGNGGFTLTLPLGADLPAGASITYSNQGGIASAPVTISRQGADTIQANGGFVNACHVESGSSLVLVHVGNGAWIATGTGVLASSGDFAASLTTNGYQNLPSGEIRQWIQAVIDSSGIVSFPIAFPNALLTVSAVSGNGVSPMYYATGSATLSSVVVTANAPGAAVVTVYATGK